MLISVSIFSIPCEELKNQNNVFDVDVLKLIINVNNSGITVSSYGIFSDTSIILKLKWIH